MGSGYTLRMQAHTANKLFTDYGPMNGETLRNFALRGQDELDELWFTLGLWQRKYAPWIPACAQPGEGTIEMASDGYNPSNRNFTTQAWPGTFDDHVPAFNYAVHANSTSTTGNGAYAYGTFIPQPAPPPSLPPSLPPGQTCAWPASLTMQSGRRLVRTGGTRGRSGGNRAGGCARYRSCATRGRRAPPNKPP